MTFEKKFAKIFNLSEDNWLKHANPRSVWTRFAILPCLILAIWSRVRIGWYSLIAIGAILFFTLINPTLFKKPKHYHRRSSKAVLGEKMLSERKEHPIPSHHKIPILLLNILQTLGGLTLGYGLWHLDFTTTLIGTLVVYISKMWFLDRMVWIYEDMNK